MKVLALDLSLTATGVVVVQTTGEERPPVDVLDRAVIRPPSRGAGETTPQWNAARFGYFRKKLYEICRVHRPEIVVTEVTEHAYQVVGGRGKKSSKGIEYRAGYGLGRAAGWLDAAVYGLDIPPYEQVAASAVKLRVAGGMSASKAAVKDGLETYFGLPTIGWNEAMVDALAVAVAWVRNKEAERAAMPAPRVRIRLKG